MVVLAVLPVPAAPVATALGVLWVRFMILSSAVLALPAVMAAPPDPAVRATAG
jgi:hypothetical protein